MSKCSSLVSPAPLPSRICVSAALKFILSQRRNDGLGLLAVTRPSSASRSCFAASRYTASSCSRIPAPGTQSADFQPAKTPSSASRSPSLRAKNSPICCRAKKNPATTTTRAITTKPSKIHKPRRRAGGLGCARRLLILRLYYQPCATEPSDQCGGGGGEPPRRGWVSAQPRPVSSPHDLSRATHPVATRKEGTVHLFTGRTGGRRIDWILARRTFP